MVFDSAARWQVACEHCGVEYWWDYDSNIRAGLEKTLAARTLLGFLWAWGDSVQALKNGKVTEYVADPVQWGWLLSKTKKTSGRARFAVRSLCHEDLG